MFSGFAFLRGCNSLRECDCFHIDAVLKWLGVLIALVAAQLLIAVPGMGQTVPSDEAASLRSAAERGGIAQPGSLTISPVARSLLIYRTADGRYLTAAAGATPWSGLAAGARSPYLHGVCIKDSTGLAPLVGILPWLSGCEGRLDAERALDVPPLPNVLIGGWPFVFGPAIIPAFAPVVTPHGPVVAPVVLAMRPLIAPSPFASSIPFVPAGLGPGAGLAGVPITAHASIPVPSAGGDGATAARIIGPGLVSRAAVPGVAVANPISVAAAVRPPASAIVSTAPTTVPTLSPVALPPLMVPAPTAAVVLPGVLIVPGSFVLPAAVGGAGVNPAMLPAAPETVPTVATGLAATAPSAGHLNSAAGPLLASPVVSVPASFITPAIAPAVGPGHPIALGHSIGPGIVIAPLPLAQSVAPIAAILGAAATASVAPLVAGGAFDIVAQALPIVAFNPLPVTMPVGMTGGSGVAALYAGAPAPGSIVAVATIATPLPAALLAQSRWGLSAPIGTALPSYPPGVFGSRAGGITVPATVSMRPLAANVIVRSVPTAHALGPALVAIAR